jgi:type I restriction enzyme, S subunit
MSFPRYKKTKPSGVEWLGDVPEHWEVAPAKWYISSASGGTSIKGHCANEPADGLYPGFSASGQDLWLESYDFDIPGIVPSAVGTRCGKTFKADGAWGVVANTHCIFPKEDSNRNYLWYLTNQEDWWEKGGSAQPFVKVSDTLARQWVFPPPSEQIQIAAFLDRETAKIDALVAEQRRLMELLKEKRQAVISHAVTQGLNPKAPMKPSGIEWLGDVPEHWDVKRLKYVSPQITVGIVVEPSKYYAEEGVPALRSLNISPGAVVLDNLVFISMEANDLHSKSKLNAGDLVAVRSGQPGTTAVIPPELDGCNCIDLIIIRKPTSGCEMFLCWYLASDVAVMQFSVGSGGAIQQHFNVGTAINLIIPVPPADEQHAIVAFINSESAKFDTLTAEAQRAIDLLQERRTALISAAVTGKIDVRS